MRTACICAVLTLLAGCASYHRLNVNSEPVNGVGIIISPHDLFLRGQGSTGFQRIYEDKETVILAPLTVQGWRFDTWRIEASNPGVQFERSGEWVSITMLADTDATAVYVQTNQPVPPPVYEYVAPSEEQVAQDRGEEIWLPGFAGFSDVRLSVNDVDKLREVVPAQGTWYCAKDTIFAGNLTLEQRADGAVVAGCNDAVSAAGVKYHLVGFCVATTSEPIVQANPIVIPPDQQRQTLRFMFATVKP